MQHPAAADPVQRRPAAADSRLARAGGFALTGLAIAAAVGLAVKTGIDILEGAPRAQVVLPVAGASAAALALMSLTGFRAFVLVVLFLRASLDAAKLGAAAPAGVDPAGLMAVLFMLAACLWLVAQRRDPAVAPLPASEPSVAFGCFLAACLLSLLGAVQPLDGFIEFTRILAVGVMLVVLERIVRDGERLRLALFAAYASAVVPIAFGLHQLASGRGTFDIQGFSRVRGTFVHSNPFAMYLALLIIMGAAIYPYLQRRGRLALLGLAVFGGACFLGTYTRGAWIAALIGLLVVGAFHDRRLVSALAIAAGLTLVFVPSVTQRFADLGEQRSLTGRASDSLTWRLDYWTEALPLANRNPVTGIGLRGIQHSTQIAKPPHNDFVRVYVETGVAGLAAYSWMLAAFARVGWRGARAPRSLARGVSVGFAGCLAALLVLSLSANVISQVAVLWYFAAFAAMAIAVHRWGHEAFERPAPEAAAAPR